MQTTSKNTQTLSGGRTASIVEIDGEEVRLITSSKRKKTISAGMRDGMIQLSVPAFMTEQQIASSARGLVAKIKFSTRSSSENQSQTAAGTANTYG